MDTLDIIIQILIIFLKANFSVIVLWMVFGIYLSIKWEYDKKLNDERKTVSDK